MLVSRGRGRFESYTVAKLCEARSEFRILGDTKGWIEITGFQQRLARNAQIAGYEGRGITDLACLMRSLREEKWRMIDPER